MGKYSNLNGADISVKDTNGKYEVGLKSDDYEKIKEYKPVFAFDYILIDNTKYSFSGDRLGSADYRKLLQGLKELSTYTYETLDKNKQFHFHEVKWSDIDISEADFYRCITDNYDGSDYLDVYQLKVFDQARVLGFLYKTVFYLVILDIGHEAYKRQDKGKGKGKKGIKGRRKQ